MSHVHRRRKRPRRRSISTYRLGWLLPRVAAWNVLAGDRDPASWPGLARWILTARLEYLSAAVRRCLTLYPDRRIRP